MSGNECMNDEGGDGEDAGCTTGADCSYCTQQGLAADWLGGCGQA